MPRLKTDEERGYIGAWMRNERIRKDRDWSPEQVLEKLPARMRVDPAYYRQWEAGTADRHPPQDTIDALIGIFGSEPIPFPEPEPEAPTGDLSALVAALTEQTKMLSALTGEAAERQRAMVIEAVREEIAPLWESIRELEARVRETLLPGAKLPGGRQ